MEVATLITGALIALGSAFLGILSDVAKSLIARRTSITDRKTAVQHQTAVELQEALNEVAREVEQIFLWYAIKQKQTGKWGDPSMPPQKDGQPMGKARARALILVERLHDDEARNTVYDMLDMGPKILTAEDFAAALRKHDVYSDVCTRANKTLGRVIRESWPN